MASELPLIEGHIHYSHDAWELASPEEAVAILPRHWLKDLPGEIADKIASKNAARLIGPNW